MLNRLDEINKDIVEDYDNFYGNYDDDHYDQDDGKYYGSAFGRQVYDGASGISENFEKYKNMFEAENLDKSQEDIGETIGGFNDWLYEITTKAKS